MTKGRKRGFTLLELLVVLAIISLLSTLALLAYNSARQKARDAERTGNVAQVRKALELYYNDAGVYPDDSGAPASSEIGVDYTCLDATGWHLGGCTGTIYLGNSPRDVQSTPTPDDPCATAVAPPCDFSYQVYGAGQTGYEVHFWLEGEIGELSGGQKCATENGVEDSCRH